MSENKYQEITNYLDKDEYLIDEPMSLHTSFKIGGPADLFAMPSTIERLQELIRICKNQGYPMHIIGNGSNLLVCDQGVKGVVIQIAKNLNSIEIQGNKVLAEAGVLLSSLAKKIYANSLAGFEFAAGIPGTLGGAVYMNAGAYGGEMKDVLTRVTAIDFHGQLHVLEKEQLDLSYRMSALQKNEWIVVKAEMEFRVGKKEDIKALMDDLAVRRRTKQPLNMPSAGSTFKRPEGYYAGKLIMDSGLMGKYIGGAMVSKKHAGFIVNNGGATCEDVLALMKYVQETVFSKYGVELETEVRRLGREGDLDNI